MPPRLMRALAGVLAALAALAASQLVAGLLGAREVPVTAVGQKVIDLTPGPIAEKIIHAIGHADKPVAVTSVVVAILLLGALVAELWQPRRVIAVLGLVLFVAVGIVAVVSRPYPATAGVLASMVGGGVALGVLTVLLPTPAEGARVDAVPDGRSRRAFVRDAAIVAGASVVMGVLGTMASGRRAAVETARKALKLPTRKVAAPAGTSVGVDGQEPWLTPTASFYRIDTSLSPPLIEPSSWRLKIHGMVDHPMTLTYQDLLDRGLSDAWITLCCVSNPVSGNLISNTVWSGVLIKGILDELGIHADADALLSTSDDGWTCGTPLSALRDGRKALLALAMNGDPLPVEHGFPVRQVVPGLYGYVSATKWVTDWEITRFDQFQAYWTQNGWSEKGPIKTESRIDKPGGHVDAGTVPVAGVAWAQNTGIAKVEVRVDGGAWQEATLGHVPSDDTWVQWRWDWDATKGDHRIEARATDKSGYTQTSAQVGVLPDGATGYPHVSVSVG